MFYFSFLNAQTLKSPNGSLEMTFKLSDDGTPSYSLKYEGRYVVLDSKLGYVLRGDAYGNTPENYMHKKYDSVDLVKEGEILAFEGTDNLKIAEEIMCGEEIIVNVDLNSGDKSATAWGCDLTYDYVKINAEYTT